MRQSESTDHVVWSLALKSFDSAQNSKHDIANVTEDIKRTFKKKLQEKKHLRNISRYC